MKGIFTILLVVLIPFGAIQSEGVGAVVEQASVGTVFSVLAGFVTGQLAWIAAPQFDEEEDPYRVELPAALATGYGLGVPFGAALGVHLASLTTNEQSSFWARWAGAEIACLVGSGASLLLIGFKSDTTSLADSPLEFTAAGLPIACAVGGAFAGDVLARRWGLVGTGEPKSLLRVGFQPSYKGLSLYCKLRIPF